MFGNTFTTSAPEWVISSSNKLKKETITVNFTPSEQGNKKLEKLVEKTYYTHIPINIKNQSTAVSHKTPKQWHVLGKDCDKFMKRLDVSFKKKLQEASHVSNVDQLKKFAVDTSLVVIDRFDDASEQVINNTIHNIGQNLVQIPDFTVPNPFLLKHWRIGTIIDFVSQHEQYTDMDIKLITLGWILTIVQGDGVSGGGTWSSTLKLRLSAASPNDVK
jgi:hypothetical protein